MGNTPFPEGAAHIPAQLGSDPTPTPSPTPAAPMPADLLVVVTAWPALPEPIKAGILAMVRATPPNPMAAAGNAPAGKGTQAKGT
jgi:hypothetical protein